MHPPTAVMLQPKEDVFDLLKADLLSERGLNLLHFGKKSERCFRSTGWLSPTLCITYCVTWLTVQVYNDTFHPQDSLHYVFEDINAFEKASLFVALEVCKQLSASKLEFLPRTRLLPLDAPVALFDVGPLRGSIPWLADTDNFALVWLMLQDYLKFSRTKHDFFGTDVDEIPPPVPYTPWQSRPNLQPPPPLEDLRRDPELNRCYAMRKERSDEEWLELERGKDGQYRQLNESARWEEYFEIADARREFKKAAIRRSGAVLHSPRRTSSESALIKTPPEEEDEGDLFDPFHDGKVTFGKLNATQPTRPIFLLPPDSVEREVRSFEEYVGVDRSSRRSEIVWYEDTFVKLTGTHLTLELFERGPIDLPLSEIAYVRRAVKPRSSKAKFRDITKVDFMLLSQRLDIEWDQASFRGATRSRDHKKAATPNKSQSTFLLKAHSQKSLLAFGSDDMRRFEEAVEEFIGTRLVGGVGGREAGQIPS